ncbi:MAG: potassium channel protein [Spirochaetes bacterium]|nr:potassium channel protein [Spirochaetota bacterium]HOD15019.1 NAD-binding protein [Spirochaetota bacterium]HPG49478.1 NAD-binding protein [Spirochaetota bacterium]
MKFLSSQFSYFFQSKNTRKNIKLLVKFFLLLVFLVTAYSVIFHYIMAHEGREHSWVTGFYWTLTVMTTLGFGDITFTGDAGKFFSIIVLMSGVVLLLVLLPFTFIQFFYAPWIEAERRSRTPHELPSHVKNHVIITGYNPVTAALIRKILDHGKDYTLVIDDIQRALDFYDRGLRVSVGDIDDPETYRLMGASRAVLVVAANSDEVNTNVAFTVREVNDQVPVICIADSPESVDILTMAGATLVLQLSDMLGRSLARRTIGGDRRANAIGRFDDLVIAETPVMGTPLVGKSLRESRLREVIGVAAVGIWDRGKFSVPEPDTIITPTTVLVIAGSEKQMMRYEELMCIYQVSADPVIIIGAGRVGYSVASSLKDRKIDYVMIDKNPLTGRPGRDFVEGNAADIDTLKKAGIDRAPAAILTTHDDATNIYLTKYCRSLRPDMQIISRADADRNVSTLHRAGADFVMSNASLGANTIYNYLESSDIVMLAEGLDIFRMRVPPGLEGKSLVESNIRQSTGCTVVAVKNPSGMVINPDPHLPMDRENELILIGNAEAEGRFLRRFGE